MASIVWPVSLPARPLIGGYEETFPDIALRTQMDAGAAKMRRRYTAAVRPLTVAYRLSDSQVTTLDDFFVNTTAAGSLPFDWVHPRTLATVSVRFTQPPRMTARGAGLWEVTIGLEVLP
jgi:hypothetical protein